MEFSVLMSIYHREQPSYFEECLMSLSTQSLQATEIVIVEDGRLTTDLYQVLDKWESLLPIRRLRLEVNSGLGVALKKGLEYCTCELVARMDTDDICAPLRFEKQLDIFRKHDVDICGSWVSEFEENIDIITSYRRTPQKHSDIVKYAKLKNPVNHPSVMYKKTSVLKAGSYEDVLYFEDYHLWLKLIDNGAQFYNIEEPLVIMRAWLGQLSRRGGINYASKEISFLKRSRDEGLLTNVDMLNSMLIRVPTRILPKKLLTFVYKKLRSI